MTESLLSIENKKQLFDENFKAITERIDIAAQSVGKKPDDIILLAATKTVDVEVINHAISKGIKYIGENRVQEFLDKFDRLQSCHRHFIGHLQTNKVKYIIDKVEMIESVDSVKLANQIAKYCRRIGKTMDILLEVNIGKEQSKSGFYAEQLEEAVEKISKIEGICIRGLMTIPPICEDRNQTRRYFEQMYKLFIDIRGKKIDNSNINLLSMGMSDDFDIAIQEGANIVRIGSALFGKRDY
ncbi:MAG TPA: YggS family pyridoxal phosphate-dependent enzyme [Clostridiales bacterium]|nr:YggS family pyridoxal phosphate-dependent enzyme [Clostridiales bacterium]